MSHYSSDAGPRLRNSWNPKATHGVALLLGILVWHGIHRERVSIESQPAEASRRLLRPDAAKEASAWIDANVEKPQSTDLVNETQAATMAEFLEDNRKEMAKWRQTRNEDLDHLIAQAERMRGPADSVAVRAALRKEGRDQDARVLFLHWLDKDPDGALAELERNRHLQRLDYLGALLELKFGSEWLVGKITDGEIPFRLRSSLVRELGLISAHETGLAGLLGHYNSISDPQLKVQMIWNFTSEWSLGEPESVAQFLTGDVPTELRDALLKNWANPPYGPSTWELGWMRELCEGLGPELTRKYYDPSAKPYVVFGPSIERYEARQSMTLSEAVQDVIAEGKSPEQAAGEAIRIKIHQALDDAGDLIEFFGEGQLTRAEFLNELSRRITESDAYPEALEREAWSMTAWTAEPQEVAKWAAELAGQQDMDELMIQTFATGNLYGDPRIPFRLARYRIVTAGMEDDRPLKRILGHAAWEWTRWQSVSPGNAETWRDALPQDEPLLSAIREEEEMNHRRRAR